MNEKEWAEKGKERKIAGEKQETEKKIKKSLKYSIWDGSFASAMSGLGESFFSAFAVFLKASNTQISLLGSLPQMFGSWAQLFSERLVIAFKSRKRFICTFAFLQALMYIPIALVFYLGEFKVYYLLLFSCLYYLFGMILGSAWTSWMGDLVSAEERGRYFGKRNTIAGFVSFFSVLTSGYILQRFTESSEQYYGFALIFSAALIFRIVSFVFLSMKYDPGIKIEEEKKESFFEFLKNAGNRNYGMFIFYLCIMRFSIFIAGPFFAAYMLYDLKLSYLQYTILIAAASVTKYSTIRIWGRAIDKYGTRKILTLSGYLMPAVSLWWVFSSNYYWLLFAEAYSGFVWAGFELASFNFLLDTITPAKRTRYVAYYNVLNGTTLFLGAMAGGLLIKYGDSFWTGYLLVFLVSGVFRYATSFYFLPKMKEVREFEEDISYPGLLIEVVADSTMDVPRQGFVFMREKVPLKKIARKSIERLKELPEEIKEVSEEISEELKELPEQALKLPKEITTRISKRIQERGIKVKGIRIKPRVVSEEAGLKSKTGVVKEAVKIKDKKIEVKKSNQKK